MIVEKKPHMTYNEKHNQTIIIKGPMEQFILNKFLLQIKAKNITITKIIE